MEKVVYRSVPSDLWRNPDKMHWTMEELCFWVCLTTNDRTSLCGVYGIHVRELAFLSRVSEDACKGLLKRFVDYGEIAYNFETHEVAIKKWIADHPIQNPNMARGVRYEVEKIKDKRLLAQVEGLVDSVKRHLGTPQINTTPPVPEPAAPTGVSSVNIGVTNPSNNTRDEGWETHDQGFPNRLSPRELETPLQEESLTELSLNSPPPPAESPKGAIGQDQSRLEKILDEVENTGRSRSAKFALTPKARELLVKIAQMSSPEAVARAWADFLKLKGQKLGIPGVVISDLPEFLEKRLDQLKKPPPVSVFLDSGRVNPTGIDETRRLSLADPVPETMYREMENFVKNLGKKTGVAS